MECAQSSWAGDSIVIIGDYDESDLYVTASDTYKDISEEIYKAFKEEAEQVSQSE